MLRIVQRSTIRTVLLGTVAALALSGAALAQTDQHQFDIPAGDAAASLRAFAKQSGKQVLFPYDAVAGKRSPAIRGALGDAEALARVADAAGLVVTSDDGRTVTLIARPQRPLAVARATAESPPANQSARVEEVIVTAQRRDERLQDVPISVTAITSKMLESNRFANVTDLNGLAPNVFFRTVQPGQSFVATTVRGYLSAPLFPGQSEGVSFYLDGVYTGVLYGAIYDIADLQQIEVLKGPQGTLFGRSSVAGAISLITANPTGEFHVSDTVTAGNFNAFKNKIHVELPRMGAFTAAFTYMHSQRDGDIKNLGAGTVWDLRAARASLPYPHTSRNEVFTAAKTLGDIDVDAVMGVVRFEPTDNFTLTYKFDYAHNDFTQGGVGDAYIGTGALVGVLAAQPPGTTLPVASNTRPKAVNDNFAGPGRQVTYGHNLTGAWQINDTFALKNIASYRASDLTFETDVNGNSGIFVPGGTRPWVESPQDYEYRYSQWSDELQLNTTTRWFDITTGAIVYVDNAIQYNLGQINFPNAGGTVVSGSGTKSDPYVLPTCTNSDQYTQCLLPSPGLAMTVGRGRTNAHTTAIYSQGQFHLTPQVDLVAGGRLSWDRSRVGGDSIYNPNQEQKDTAPVYVLGVNYKPESDKLLYVKWSTGFIPGGIFNTFPYNPVTSTSYEIGIKADWLDHTVRTNLSVFDAAYKGLQTFSISFTPALTLKVINAGEAKAKGFEFEGTWLPVQGVTLGTAIGYTDLTFVDHITVPQGVPKWTADFNANYESPAQDWAAGGRFTARVDASYTSSVALASGCIAGPKNFRGIIPCSVTPAILAATNAPSKWNINGRVGLADINVGHAMGSPTTWQVALWVRNLLDNDGLQSAVTQSRSGSYSANYDPARTFGVDVNVKF